MVSDRLALLRRRSVVGWAIIAALVLIVLFAQTAFDPSDFGYVIQPFLIFFVWMLVSAWVWLDSAYRGKSPLPWVLLTLITGPLGLFAYLVTRPAFTEICIKCGSEISSQQDICPYCGNQSLLKKMGNKLQWVWQDLLRSIAGGPADKAKETVKHLAIGSAAATFFFWLLCAATEGRVLLFQIMLLLSMASYWVLIAWWVYVDATWRRMEAVPWGLLTLVTNIFGLVTYLVIRYPEPRSCPQCSASLPNNLKRCPYCGSEVEPSCPRCQSPVKSDWLFCPACAAQISRPQPASVSEDEISTSSEPPPVPEEEVHTPPTACIRGTVVDAVTGAPVANTLVKIDSRLTVRSTTTDSQGRYELADMPLQPYVLLASAKGYAMDAQTFEPDAGTLAQVHFALQPLVEEVTGVFLQ